jgi:hypothetical protein
MINNIVIRYHLGLLGLFGLFASINTLAKTLKILPTDINVSYPFSIPENTYHHYCKNIYSQNGEDGILEQLIKELTITEGTFCEFGASNGISSSNTYNLIKNHNFSGIAIELNEERYTQCVKNYTLFPNVQVFHGGIFYNDPNNDLNAWLTRGNLPFDFDILSIDIDCDDYYVWENLTDFSPKIIIIETNPYRDPVYEELPGKPSHEYNIDLLRQWRHQNIAIGASFISIVMFGLKKGYIPVSYTGNLVFVRKDLVNQLREFPYILSDNPYAYLRLYTHIALWDNTWLTNTGLILNVAIRDYYLQFKQKYIDIKWINKRMAEILQNKNVIF